MNDFRLIPQQLVEEMATRYDEEKEKYICKMLYDLKIDKDILENQVQEIHRLNKVIAEYEQLEEQGLLLKLPCRVGDIIYEVDESILLDNVIEPIECKVNYIIFKSSIHMGVEVIKGHGVGSSYNFEIEDFGKTVFLTKEEAEKALDIVKRGGKDE